MLNFFKRLRKKLIDDGNLKRYIIYAFGEILLVMVGILLALQVSKWNEGVKANKQEQELADKLYGELLEYQNYCTLFLVRSSEEIGYDEFILKNWRTLTLDKIKQYREEELPPFYQTFAIKSAFGGFQYYFEPKFPYYKTSVNEGTISILKDKEFANQLEFIYTVGSHRVEDFYDSAGKTGGEMGKHITQKYDHLFIESDPAILGDWDEPSYESFFALIKKDGQLKSLLEERYGLWKLKKFTVERQIIPTIEKLVSYYKESDYYHSDSESEIDE